MVLSLPVRLLVATLVIASSSSIFGISTCLADTVLLAFSSPTCGPCQKMRPVVDRLVAAGLPVREVDISREPELKARFEMPDD